MTAWLNPTGGLLYHFRALRHSRSKWGPFRCEIDEWLNAWNPTEKSLVLIGPSGGYTLSEKFLDRFDSIVMVDLDPLARVFFSSRFRSLKGRVNWDGRDYFRNSRGILDFSRTEDFLDVYANHSLLFCNILGQLKFLTPPRMSEARFDELLSDFMLRLGRALCARSHSSASYHDRLSGRVGPRAPSLKNLACWQSNQELAQIADVTGFSQPPELIDHQTEALLRGLESSSSALSICYLDWLIAPGYHHWIEAVSIRRSSRP